jgi:CheB methylesterase
LCIGGCHDSSRRSALDTFFASLAEDCGHKAVAIVLSGVGSDGARGVNQSRWFIEFENEPIEVVRANILENGVIVSEFNGFDGSSRFGFASGCVWERAEYTTPIDPMRSSLTA